MDKTLQRLQRVRVGLEAALQELDEIQKQIDQAPAQPGERQRRNLKKNRIDRHARRYAIK